MKSKMNKAMVVAKYKALILPSLKDDQPAKLLAWNCFVDRLQKDGFIAEKQAREWCQPACVRV